MRRRELGRLGAPLPATRWTAALGVRLRRAAAGLALAAAASSALAAPALAAVIAQLSSPQGRPGDRVALSTDDRGNREAYTGLAVAGGNRLYLVGTADYEQELRQRGGQVCGLPEQRYLGLLSWRDDVGSLVFSIPDVPPGGYYFEMTVGDQCWRVGGPDGPLVLTVGDQPALPLAEPSAPVPKPRPAGGVPEPRGGPPLGVALAVLTGGIAAAAVAWRLRGARRP